MTKPETLDCVNVKQRAQRELAKALAGQSPDEQAETLHRLAAKTSLWKSLTEARPKQTPKSAHTPTRKRRSTG